MPGASPSPCDHSRRSDVDFDNSIAPPRGGRGGRRVAEGRGGGKSGKMWRVSGCPPRPKGSTMRTSSAALAILLGVLPGAPLLGDDVYLKNGRSFENVVAEVGDAQVRVHMPGGVVSLPRSAVDRVEKSDSSFAEYSRRQQDLESRARGPRPPSAADWLELARWARANKLPQAERESALRAAEINPRDPGLAGLLRGFGYVYEESLDRWIPYDDAMRLHGMVQEGGTWVSREEHVARLQAQSGQQAVRAAAAAAARDEAAAAMLQAQAALAQQGAADNGYGGGMTLGGF